MKFSFPKTKIKFKKKQLNKFARVSFWFSTGAVLALFLITSFGYIIFQSAYKGKVYPGIKVNGISFGGKNKSDLENYFSQKNKNAKDAVFTFSYEDNIATFSASEIHFGYNSRLLADQAYSVGRGSDSISNVSLIIQAYAGGINLSPSYSFSQDSLNRKLSPIYKKINKKPVEAIFNFVDGKVTQFVPSQTGRQVDVDELNQRVLSKADSVLNYTSNKNIAVDIPVKVLKPTLTTDKVNKMGINELIGSGTSLFMGSIESRIYNVNLAATRVNGTLVKPGDTFSFAQAVGDVSNLTGYKQAYVIQNGKTVLGDGGGVCQVSTTLFRAALNAGLPIVERHAHAYRVHYYEEDSPAGVDATVYVPTVDLKFKNDTGHYILIQSIIDLSQPRLTFMIYGTSDGRIVSQTIPVVTNIRPAPPDKFEDDPTLPVGTIKQVDFAAGGADASFTRTVTRNGKILDQDTFTSHYTPWQAVFLRGTKT